jgi:hypothetical protein
VPFVVVIGIRSLVIGIYSIYQHSNRIPIEAIIKSSFYCTMLTSMINDVENLRFDLSMMGSTAICESTDTVVVLTKQPLHKDNNLDACTATTTSTYDDSASVSSVSSLGSTATTTTMRRSVFSKYWESTGQEPPQPLQRRPRGIGGISSSPSSSSESLPLRTQETSSSSAKTTPPTTAPGRRRRSILQPQAHRSYSVPSGMSSRTVPITRKSASSIELKAKDSCLRETRFSGATRRRRSSGASSSNTNTNNNDSSQPRPHSTTNSSLLVRFDMESIDVLHFQPPLECYALERWADHFV